MDFKTQLTKLYKITTLLINKGQQQKLPFCIVIIIIIIIVIIRVAIVIVVLILMTTLIFKPCQCGRAVAHYH